MEVPKPVLKWVGGKTQIIDNVLSKFPEKINSYHEIFLGGGSVLITFLTYVKNNKIQVKNIYAYDLNETLIHLYKNIQKCSNELIQRLEEIITDYNIALEDNKKIKANRKPKNIDEAKTSKEAYYYWIRERYNKLSQDEKNKPLGSAIFIFLNKTCFRGLYRTGPNGFNVPYGNYKNPSIYDNENIKTISDLIKNVEFIVSDFSGSIIRAKKKDFLYLDPPYVPEKETSFVKYNEDGFNLAKHKELFKLCHELKDKKIKFLFSNSSVKMIHDEFKDYNIETIDCKRSINSKNPGKKTKEVLINN